MKTNSARQKNSAEMVDATGMFIGLIIAGIACIVGGILLFMFDPFQMGGSQYGIYVAILAAGGFFLFLVVIIQKNQEP